MEPRLDRDGTVDLFEFVVACNDRVRSCKPGALGSDDEIKLVERSQDIFVRRVGNQRVYTVAANRQRQCFSISSRA